MTEPHEHRERAIELLRGALEAETLAEKDYYVREALQLVKLAPRGNDRAAERKTD